ncbi:hypothetical protein [Georgenia faecalis]|uniref:hypothetical protein n=1 Tax=Georgenia faecalis TaxID=2483799 RepID=UPI000FDBDBD1|nr:hypothetical protein [Georgenia faecalis]
MGIAAQIELAAPAPAVGITISGLDETAPSRVALYRQHAGEGRTVVQGASDVSMTGAGYVVDYLPPLGRVVTYTVEVLEGAIVPAVLSTQVEIETQAAWLQDALNPLLAAEIGLSRAAGGGDIWFTTGALARLERHIAAQTVVPMGSRYPVIMEGTRQAPAGIPLTMITAAAEAGSRLRTLLSESQHLVLRVPPRMSQLDAVVHLGDVQMPEEPLTDSMSRWLVTGTQTRGPRVGVYTALWTYDDIAALYAGATYTDVADGRTYVEWQRAPEDRGIASLMGVMSGA